MCAIVFFFLKKCLELILFFPAEHKEELKDEDRIEICKNLKTYLEERDSILNGTGVESDAEQIVEEYWNLSEVCTV